MKRNLVFAILLVCAVTAAAVTFLRPALKPQPAQAPVVTEQASPQPQAQIPAPQQQADTETTPVPTVLPPQATPPAPVTTDTPPAQADAATPVDATPPQSNDNVAMLPDASVPLPPRRPTLSESGEPIPELALSQVHKGSPVFIRIFKKESVLELWVKQEGRFRFVKKYPICAWSGALGPKQKNGDYQAPEGFYAVTKKQLNPNSSYYRAFNVGFPNAFDRQLGRTGSALMVHGACASVGCYAMTDPGIGEIYPLVEAALNAGQKAVPLDIFPFRMTSAALRAQTGNQWHSFWTDLKIGYDRFEKTRTPPTAFACNGRYVLDEKEAEKAGCQKITGWL